MKRAACLVAWWCAGCASHIAPVVLPARVATEAAPVPEVRACWVEYATAAGLTSSGVVIHHPQGVVVVDVGQSRNFAAEIADRPLGDWWYLRAVPGGVIPSQPASEVLRAAGVTKIRYVLPTHVHSDHVGGVMDLPDVTVLLSKAEQDHLEHAGEQKPFNVMPQHARRLAGHLQEIAFVDQPYETFPAHADVLGDGSVVVVPLDGHTPGSVGVFINLPGQRIFYVGDAINTVDALTELRGKAFYLARTDLDVARADAQVAQLAALHKQHPTLRFLPGHERSSWERLFGAPQGCLPR